MKNVTMTIMCDDDAAGGMAHEMINSHLTQYGLLCWGTYIENCTEEEEREVQFRLPDEILIESK